MGGHDGTVNGVRRFSANQGHGIIVGLSDIVQKLSAAQLTDKLEQIITLCSGKFTEYLKAVTERDAFIDRLKETVYSLKKQLKAAKSANNTKNNSKYHHSAQNSDSSVLQLSHMGPPTALTAELSNESIEETVYDFTLMSPVPRKAGQFFHEFQKDLNEKRKAKKSIKKIHIEKHCEYTKWKHKRNLTKELSALSSIDSSDWSEEDETELYTKKNLKKHKK